MSDDRGDPEARARALIDSIKDMPLEEQYQKVKAACRRLGPEIGGTDAFAEWASKNSKFMVERMFAPD